MKSLDTTWGKAIDNKIRVILLKHTNCIYGYFRSKGKDNFDDTVFVNKILALFASQQKELAEGIGKMKKSSVKVYELKMNGIEDLKSWAEGFDQCLDEVLAYIKEKIK